MTNYEKWRALTADLEAPDQFLDAAWYYANAASAERRIWWGDPARPMYVNLYVLLVGPPAIGKGTSMREARKLLNRFVYKQPDGSQLMDPDTKEPQMTFQCLPDTVTFEKLAFAMADSIRHFVKADGNIATHSSMYFSLEELSSLLRKGKADDVSRFLLNLYDGIEYKYSTRHQQTALIKNGCLNLLAGTQVSFLRDAEKAGLVGEGLFSRFIIVYGDKRRQVKFHYSDLSPEQKQYQADLQKWLYDASTRYGQLTYADPQTHEWLEDWWQKEVEYMDQFADDKLADYFSRRKEHVMKLAAAIHLSESHDLRVSHSAFIKATDYMRQFESGVIRIARRSGRNELYPIQERIVAYVKQAPRRSSDILKRFESEIDLSEFLNTMALLQQTNRLTQTDDEWTYNNGTHS